MNNDNQARWQKREAELGVCITYNQTTGRFIVRGNAQFYNGATLIHSRLGKRSASLTQNGDGIKVEWKARCNSRNANRIRKATALGVMHADKSLHDMSIILYGEGLPEDINTRVTYTEA